LTSPTDDHSVTPISTSGPAPAGAPPNLPGLSSVLTRIGARPDADDETAGWIVSRDAIRHHGHVRPSTLMMLADVVVGMRLESAVPEWTFTTDYSLRIATPTTVAEGHPILARSHLLRAGRRLIVERVAYTDDAGAMLAEAQVTFMRVEQRVGDDPKPDIGDIRRRIAEAPEWPLEEPLPDAAGIRVVDAAAGVVELDITARIMRPGGIVQGSVMTLLGEVAATAMAEATSGPCRITAIDVRYLLGGRTGPLVTRSWWLGPPAAGTIAVEVLDHGRGDAICTTFYVTLEPIDR
jgi:acyl-coenzyme A thioesterase PaaI-like protein